jgi:hypothetical protein
MKTNIEEMLMSNDKDCVYLACTMIRKQPQMIDLEIKKKAKEISLFDKIRSYSDVCEELGEKELSLSDFDFLDIEYRNKILNQSKLKQIEKLFNFDFKIDWSNHNQYKYYPYFEVSGSGLGLGFYGSYYDGSGFGGLPAYFKDRETSDFVGKTFVDIYKELL